MISSELSRTRIPRSLAVVVACAAAATAALVACRPQLGGAVLARGDDLALVVAWAVALATSAWLGAVTAACAFAMRGGRPDVALRLAPALPVALRRIVEIAIVAACVAVPVVPASAAPASTTTFPVVADQPVVRAPTVATSATTTTTVAPADVPVVATPAPVTPAPTAHAAAARVVVRPGDNLWLIARGSLTRVSARPPTDAEVMRHWLAVIAANRSTLRSGNPSLIFPGEIVTVPAAPEVS